MKFITCFFLISIIPIVTPIQFNFTFTNPQSYNNQEIDIEGGGAYISGAGIQLTPDRSVAGERQKAGRATYFRLLHLWDSKSNKVASFSTNFTFVIDSNKSGNDSDGLTFFLAERNSRLRTDGSMGAMGLPITQSGSATRYRFVAVEFDTFWNKWDPNDTNNSPVGDHVGISISSLKSVEYRKWLSDVNDSRVCHSSIKYDSDSEIFSVLFTGYKNNSIINQDGFSRKTKLRKELPEWVIFGFSAATETLFSRNIIRSWSFQSSDLDVDGSNDRGSGSSRKVGLIVGLTVAISFVVVFFVVLWRLKMRKKEGGGGEELDFDIEMNNDFEMGSGPKRFSYHELARSTEDFALNQKLGEGGFGGVYRGYLRELKTYVAVKRMSKTSKQGIKQYASEVKIISRLRHKNLVQLVGWCHENRELLLVYEYMENGSLDTHLFNKHRFLEWGKRYKIAHGLASGLLYLHDEWEQCVLHRDIKSSNVMLDSNFNAKLGDFGLAKLVDHDQGLKTTLLAGTLGYMAPECIVTGKASKQSDVFSFGVVALEIACGRKPIAYKGQESQTRLVEWVWDHYTSETLLDAVDPRLGLDFKEDEMKRLMMIGLWCMHPDSSERPSMKQVVQVFNCEVSVPVLSSTMPVASFETPSISSPLGVQNESSSTVSHTDSVKQTTSSTASSCSPTVSLLHSQQ